MLVLHAFTDFVEVKPQAIEAQSDDDLHISIKEIPSHEDDDDDASMQGSSQ